MYHAGGQPITQLLSTYFVGTAQGEGEGGYAPILNNERRGKKQLLEQQERGLK
tara:strand:+ start:261 stop:419 length:159 start_codon:yes stop_codon:yes gene_type:complete